MIAAASSFDLAASTDFITVSVALVKLPQMQIENINSSEFALRGLINERISNRNNVLKRLKSMDSDLILNCFTFALFKILHGYMVHCNTTSNATNQVC
jgi:hypothetical protein